MDLPPPVFYPPFNITRASHAVLTVKELQASRKFYTEVIGLVVSDETADAIYLRGLEEACHHSLVLIKTQADAATLRVGMRVLTEHELDKAKEYFDSLALPSTWVESPFQGRTLHFSDPSGAAYELCANMKTEQRLYTNFHLFKGGAAQRFDHVQILAPDVAESTTFFARFGFRISEYMCTGGRLTASFMYRKGDTQDLVFFAGRGPRLHHFAYTISESHNILRACDVAGIHGFGDKVERGPQRHGPAGVFFVYFRDPDGHRVELFCNHYQTIDAEIEPVEWDLTKPGIALRWGLPAQASWFNEATKFHNVSTKSAPLEAPPITLEDYLSIKASKNGTSPAGSEDLVHPT